MSDTPDLHIYAQRCPHDDLLVVGNRDGLRLLLAATMDALARGTSKDNTAFVAHDGDGYDVIVRMEEDDALLGYVHPYTAPEYEAERDAATHAGTWPKQAPEERPSCS